MAEPVFSKFENRTGDSFRTLSWHGRDNPDTLLMIHHGVGEHALRYQTFADNLLHDVNVNMVSFDIRGHGESDGKRGDADGLGGLASDFEEVLHHFVDEYAPQHVYVAGHSLGAASVLHYMTHQQPHDLIRGLILSAPPVHVSTNLSQKAKIAVGRILKLVAPTVTLPTGLPATGISKVAAEVERYKQDPHVHDLLSARLAISIVDGGDLIVSRAGRINVPVLLYHGADDPISHVEGSRKLSAGFGTDDVEYIEWEGMLHETHHESEEERAQVFASIKTWLDKQMG